ncbi:MAG: FAD-binding protein [Acidobacteria bacterium]|nr:FAD-binding protein [Acidobacteriota bacterium]
MAGMADGRFADALRARIRGGVLPPGLFLDEHRTNFGRIFHREPGAVVLPAGTDDVAETIRFAREEGIPVTTRGAAHSQSQVGISDGGILIDMKAMGSILAVDGGEPAVEVEAGAIWREVLERTWKEGLVPPVLTNNLAVTVGGTLSTGGVGVASFRHGTQADHVLEAEVVTGAGEVRRCSRRSDAELYWAVLAGLGQCGVITRARLELRRARPRVRTHYLLYDSLDRFLEDASRVIDSGRFDYLESWCSPCPQGLRSGPEGRRPFARWFFPFHLSVEFEAGEEPRDEDLLRGLRPLERLHREDLPTPAFLRRLEPLFDLWKRGGTWEFAHPWMETILPMDRAAEYIRSVLADLPPQVTVGGHVLLWVSGGSVSRVPLFMRPEAAHVVGFGILPAVPHRWLDAFLPRLEAASDLSQEYGGKRYLSGYVRFDREGWKRHFGSRWEEFRRLKGKYDPDGLLNTGFPPLLAEAGESDSPPPPGPGEAEGPHDFGSPAWARAVAARINADPDYRAAGRGWGIGFNGDLVLQVDPDGDWKRSIRFLLRLRDGTCQGVDLLEEDARPAAGFVLRGPFPVWRGILEGRIRPMLALMTRRIQMEGSLSTLLRFQKATQVLVRATSGVPTRFSA